MMNSMKTGAYIYNDELYNFNFYTNISASDKLKFVNSVVSILIDENNYHSIIRDLIFDFYIVDVFTDVDTKDLKSSPVFINDVEDFLLSTNIVEIVRANSLPYLFDELNSAVDKSIEYLTGIHPNPLSDAFTKLIFALEKKVSEVDLDSVMTMAQKFASMTDELTSDSIVNAYMNSDIHKKNLAEIEESKKQKTELAKNLDMAIKSVNNK